MDKILVVGSREWDNWTLLRETLEGVFDLDRMLIHCDTRGAEKMSAYVWDEWGGMHKGYAPNWETHGKSAGYRRVEGLLISKPLALVAFVKDNDPVVLHAIEAAKERNIQFVRVDYVPEEKVNATAPASGDASAKASVTEPAF